MKRRDKKKIKSRDEDGGRREKRKSKRKPSEGPVSSGHPGGQWENLFICLLSYMEKQATYITFDIKVH